MKKIKRLLILLIVVFLSGCTVDYNLTINSDLSIKEEVVATEYTNRMKSNTGLDEKESIKYLYEMFDRKDLNTIISSKTEDNNTISKVTGSHDSLSNYVSNFTSDVVEQVSYSEDNSIVTLIFNQTGSLSSESSESLIYDEIRFNIIVPFKVIDSNATSHSRDTYTWVLKKDEKLKQMKISFDKDNLKYQRKINFGDRSINIRYGHVIIISSVLLVLVIITIVYLNNKKNNRL